MLCQIYYQYRSIDELSMKTWLNAHEHHWYKGTNSKSFEGFQILVLRKKVDYAKLKIDFWMKVRMKEEKKVPHGPGSIVYQDKILMAFLQNN